MKTILALTLSLAALVLTIPSAEAGGRRVITSYSSPTCAPTYYRPAPRVVYVQPRVYRPAPVYYRPAPVYYRPAPVCYRPSLSFTAGVSIGAGRHHWRR